MYLSDCRCNSSSADFRVLVAITSHSPIPPVEGTHYHRQRASPSHYCTHQGSETPLTYPVASHPRTRGAPQWDSKIVYIQGDSKVLSKRVIEPNIET
ncbi:hypothetical protein AVEN_118346-1 [Araneus ventricosus]|uniref:Uncharacterized protein n=1 Tax=Araneus ventricosus TaxID=182803 RepID=A0A4Y2B4Z2_ARAVE|nr:hypothetical protein AVEN_118346-1 [Araneus ventricosus]